MMRNKSSLPRFNRLLLKNLSPEVALMTAALWEIVKVATTRSNIDRDRCVNFIFEGYHLERYLDRYLIPLEPEVVRKFTRNHMEINTNG